MTQKMTQDCDKESKLDELAETIKMLEKSIEEAK